MVAQLQRHIGRITNTGANCVVVFIKLEGDEENALIIESESLPPKYSDLFAEAVMSREAQEEPELSKVLSRKIFAAGATMLNLLHQEGYLVKMPINNITMLPTRNTAMPLREIIDAMNPGAAKKDGGDVSKDFAVSKMTEAKRLEERAKELKLEAYALNPKLDKRRKKKAPVA